LYCIDTSNRHHLLPSITNVTQPCYLQDRRRRQRQQQHNDDTHDNGDKRVTALQLQFNI